jgi:hypothetical protein
MSSDTSSMNSLDQTLRVRIGGTLPKGLLNASQSSTTGVNPNHFYQSSTLNRDFSSNGATYSQQPVNFTTNNSNFNSLDYSEAAVSSRRVFNDSNQAVATSNVKRNNFLGNDEKSPEVCSQPNPPTLRKITLNQRILQKNMARVSTG